jgi:hypothetical protein
VVDDDYSDPGYVYRYFSRFVHDPETDHLKPEIRMVRLYVGRRRAFLERRWHPEHGPSDWAIICPNPDISEREVAAVWKARSLAFTADVRLGRPRGPTPGNDAERWVARVAALRGVVAGDPGERAARREFYATENRKPRNERRGWRWWKESVLYHLKKRG